MGVAQGGADIFVAKQLLGFAESFSHVVKQDRSGAVAQPVGGDLFSPSRKRCSSEGGTN